MAKRRPGVEGQATTQGTEPTSASTTKLEEFAEDLGRLLGTAQAKAEGWLGQRQAVAKQLTAIRDTASSLLNQLGDITVRRGRRKGLPGRPRKAPGIKATASGAYPHRKLSVKAREAISRAQKKRWAKQKAAAKGQA